MAQDSPLPGVPVRHPDSVTPASAWRSSAKDGFVVELPSGNRARLRRTMNLVSLLESGQIPNPLAGAVRTMIGERKVEINVGEDTPEAMLQMLELVNTQLPRIFVEPRVEVQPADWNAAEQGEWEPSEGAIALVDIDYPDRMFAFSYAQGQALDLDDFRARQAEAMANLQHGARVAHDPGNLAASDGPVPGVVPERGDVDVRPSRDDSGGTSGGDADEAGSAERGEGASAEAPVGGTISASNITEGQVTFGGQLTAAPVSSG